MPPDGATIYAQATPTGRSGVAIIRISGPAAGAVLTALAGAVPAPRRATLRRLREGGAALDTALILWFPGPASFTGEDMAELHIHGGAALGKAVLAAIGRQVGTRPAEPGEFTRRAFDNGRLDLTEVEGLADLIAAETEAQRRQALRQLDGDLGQLYGAWSARLTGALAHAEAAIEFTDGEVPDEIDGAGRAEITAVLAEIARHLDDCGRGQRIREGLEIAVIGPPNAGKSTLVNALARRPVAIVTEIAGTTRDVLEVPLDIGGRAVTLCDTAGLRQARDRIEAAGVDLARSRAARADLVVAVISAAEAPFDGVPVDPVEAAGNRVDLIVVNKIDLVAGLRPGRREDRVYLSALTGVGLEALSTRLAELSARAAPESAGPVITRARHRHAVEAAAAALRRSLTAGLPELAAEDLRLAVRSLGRITGRVDVEDLLDRIFADFCIGK